MGSRVVVVDPTSNDLWEQLCREQPSDVFHSPAWLTVLTNTYGFDLEARVLVDDADRPTAGMVYSEISDQLGTRVVSLPFSDYCDPLIGDSGHWSALADGLIGPATRFQVKCLHAAIDDPRLVTSGQQAWHAVDATRPLDVIWGDLAGSARRAIRKAEASGISVRAAESETDLRAFYDLHLRVRKYKYGLLAQPYSFFENIWHHFIAPGRGVLLLAQEGSTVVGGVLYLQWKDTLYYKFNASDPDHLGVRPNDLIVWEGIKTAHSAGLNWLDFGVSDLDQEGLVRYKRKYATREAIVTTLRTPVDPSPHETSFRTTLSEITALLTSPDVPDRHTARAGEILYRYFT